MKGLLIPVWQSPALSSLQSESTAFEAADIGEQAVDRPHCGQEHMWRREDAYLDAAGGGN